MIRVLGKPIKLIILPIPTCQNSHVFFLQHDKQANQIGL